MPLLMTLAVIVVLSTILLLTKLFGRPGIEPWVKNLGIAQTALSITALVIAAAWYFVDRPHDAKLKFEQNVNGFAVGSDRVLVVAELSLTNVGGSAVDLRGNPYWLYLQQITPLTTTPYSEIGALDKSRASLEIHPADTWSLIAQRSDKLTTFLGSGEVENLYYRVIIPCKPDLRVYFTSWVGKPRLWSDFMFSSGADTWIKQSLLDLSQQCAAKSALPTPTSQKAAPPGR